MKQSKAEPTSRLAKHPESKWFLRDANPFGVRVCFFSLGVALTHAIIQIGQFEQDIQGLQEAVLYCNRQSQLAGA